MCGIVGFTGSQNAAPILLDGLKKLEYRGYDSAGIAVLGDEGIHMEKASGMIRNLDAKIQGGAALFCEGIRGDYYNVMGLPVCRLGQVLKKKAPQLMEDTQ